MCFSAPTAFNFACIVNYEREEASFTLELSGSGDHKDERKSPC